MPLMIRDPVLALLNKKPPPSPARVWFWVLRCPLAPSSILPPAAGNEYYYVLNADNDEAEEAEDGEIDQAEVFGRHLDTPAVSPHEDGDVAAIAAVEKTQRGSP